MAQENTKELTAVQLSEQEGFRRDKLKALQEAGNDPFEIVKYDVTHHSSEVLNGFDELEGKVVSVDAKGALVELADGVEGYIRASDVSQERVEDATTVLSKDQEIEAKFMGVDRKNRQISLSIRAKDEADDKAAIESVNSRQPQVAAPSAMAEAFKNAQKAE